MADLSIDYGELAVARDRIAATAETLRVAQLAGDELANLAAHPRLAGKVRDFAGNWDYRRGQLMNALQHLDDSIRAIEDTFADIDRSMSAEFKDAASPEDPR